MKRLSLPRLLILHRERIGRVFYLEKAGRHMHAARGWAAVYRLVRAIEARYAAQTERRSVA